MERAAIARGDVAVGVQRRNCDAETAARGGGRRALTVKWVAAAAFTLTAPVPTIELLLISVPVIVSLAAVFSVALNVPTPPLSVEVAGRTAAVSLLVKWIWSA